jgi:CRP/FNR family transcriptional regulator, cyclic AMP receptor protein
MEPLTALEQSTDFAPAGRATLERLAARMVPREFPAGTTVFAEGDPTGPAYLVGSGRVRLTSVRSDGRPQPLAMLGPGSLAGEMTALLGRARTASATAVEDVAAWELPADAIQAAFRDDQRLAHTMMLTVMELMIDQDAQAVRQLGLGPVERLATVILDRHRGERVAEGEPLSLSTADLAVLVGETPTAFVMNLSRLRRAGAVETRDDRVVVTSVERLRRLAGA